MSSSQSSDGLLSVNSKVLKQAADMIRGKAPMALRNGVVVSANQLETAAMLIARAEPSVVTSPRSMRSVEERPGYIDAQRQDDPNVLTLDIGILPSTQYRIDREGKVLT